MATSKESLKFTLSRFHSNVMQHNTAPPFISYCLFAFSLIQSCAIHITTIVYSLLGQLFQIRNTYFNTAIHSHISIDSTLCIRKRLNNHQPCI